MPGIGFFSRPYSYVNRYRKVVAVLIKYGFEDFISSLHLRRYFPFRKMRFSQKKRGKKAVLDMSRWERTRLVLEELGTTFIKFGQIMSNRPDMLPPSLIRELEKLQDKVPPFPGEKVKKVIEEDLGTSITSLFSEFDGEPFASASIAQVHRGKLNDGSEVAVKVQRPGIREIVEIDIAIMTDFAVLINKYVPSLSIFDPVGIVKTFEKVIYREMNFSIEASYIERFNANFKDNENIYVPGILREYTSPKVLTLELVNGIKISDTETLTEKGFDLKLLASRGFDLFLMQVFDHGFFHADPHPGNILALPGNRLCFIDFGMMGLISQQDKQLLGNMIIGMQIRDTRKIVRSLNILSGSKTIENTRDLENELSDFLNEYYYQRLEDIEIKHLINRLRNIIVSYNIHVPSDFFLLMKALVIIEGVGRSLDPEFNAFLRIEPYVKKLQMKRMNPWNMLKDLYYSSLDLSYVFKDLPYDIRDVIDRIKGGEVNVDIEHKGIEPLLHTYDKISNRISFAIVLASLIVGSSLIVLSGIPPYWNEIPVIGIIGFLIAGVMGLWLLFSIIRHGKM